MSVIDADGHIIEPEAIFEHLPEEFYPRRPIPVHLPVDTVRGDFNGCWLIEGKAFLTLAAVDGPQLRCRGRNGRKRSMCPLGHRLWKTSKPECPTWIGSTSTAK